MKRSNFVTKIISFLLFGAMLCYLGVYVFRLFSNNFRTAPAVRVEIVDSVAVEGLIVRDEEVVSSSESFISISAENGTLVAKGEALAVSYTGESALERASLIREKELQRQYVVAALEGAASEKDISRRDSSIKNSIISLTAAVATGQLDAAGEAGVTLASLVMEDPEIYATQVDLELITEELSRLRSAAAYDTKAILAPSTGLFFASADGFEHLTQESVTGIGTDALREFFTAAEEPPENMLGKIANPLEWYYAAIVPFETVQRMEVGGYVSLDFGRYCSQTLRALVVSVKYNQDKDCVVVFRCTGSAVEMLYARHVTAEIVFDTIVGLRVPKEAVYEENLEVENAETGGRELQIRQYIYTVTGIQAEKKYITNLWESDDYYIAEIQMDKTGDSEASLREANDIILTSHEIYDGMLLE